MTEYAFEGAKRASTTITWSFATQTYAADLAVPFSSPIDQIYQSTIQAAFNRWASVSGLMFPEVPDSANSAIRIGFGTFSSSAIVGQTRIAASAGILRPDTIVRLLDPVQQALALDPQGAWSYAAFNLTVFQVAVHEIGHALGLDHSTDPNAIMYPIATAANTDLDFGDIEGIDTLYPLYTVAALDPVQVEGSNGPTTYRFVITRASDPNLALTVGYAVTGAIYPGFNGPGFNGTVAAAGSDFQGGAFPSGQITFARGATTATLAVSVAGDTAAEADEGFAISLSSTDPTDSITVRGTVNAVILNDDGYAVVAANTIGVYRFFDTDDGTHFFTASVQERNSLIQARTDLVYEGPDLNAVADPSADPAAAPVFRFFDARYGTHFYTASAAERDTVTSTRPDLVDEGIGFYEHVTQQSGDAPVYRFFDTRYGTHFYTASPGERATILATRSDLTDEGVGFYAPTMA